MLRVYLTIEIGVNAETCIYADGITLLHLDVVEHSVRRASGCSFAILQSSRPLWSFTLRVAPHVSGESTLMWLYTGSSRICARTKLH